MAVRTYCGLYSLQALANKVALAQVAAAQTPASEVSDGLKRLSRPIGR